ncbi:NADP transhydrogenase, mitochondrial [Hondaea fermentalgiana]|uniref:proton-translocating NAD(P)(+) transhydrogenase n=1 Tax=Hondaea fermentalgiana TaxID=2315210 RepID=A0A2R5G789_9STRA|nr:NADP transhydrogenase, mitochondrial [Hondaea fermentalgiana]|eukprot:GBG26917.1 NADP transhydrogenase, mitochondrial [Hondaea fermentalgiana]
MVANMHGAVLRHGAGLVRAAAQRNALAGPRAHAARALSAAASQGEGKNIRIGIIKEGEERVGMVPENLDKLVKKGAEVQVQDGAGVAAGFSNSQYEAAGAKIVSGEEVWKSDVVVTINKPSSDDLKKLEDRLIVSQLQARNDPAVYDQLAEQKATGLSLDMLMRTLSRGQAFDVLSSQANVAGYRAVIEAGYQFQRPFAGQMTAAGRINPARVLVCGTGVAGLAAIQAAKNLGAVVNAFDVRAAAAEQVQSMGANFLKVESDEDGSAAGGYAKEMSAEWFEAARKMLLKECASTDIIITTAQIPGKKAPVLITKEMVEAMPSGGVTVDLAASTGGNVETTQLDKVVSITGKNGQTINCVGYGNMPARMASVASTLFGGNVSKLLLSMYDKEGNFVVNESDEAVRSMLIVNAGKKLEPYNPPPPPVAPVSDEPKEEPKPVDPQQKTLETVLLGTGISSAAIGVGSKVPDTGLLATFALSVWLGSGSVRGVAHSLHSPLMSITNAISGMTIVGGMLQLGGGILPHTMPQLLGATAVTLSAVNLTGGFMVTNKMLDMFRRKDDPPEFNHYYLLPPAVAVGGLGLASLAGNSSAVAGTLGLASGLGCIAGISQMSSQSTTRIAPYAAMGGVGMGIASALQAMDVPASVYGQLAITSAIGGGAGYALAGRIGPTQLPQAVAGFHSLVGVAATSTAVGDFLTHDFTHFDGFHASSIYLGAFMGSITATGSVIAFGKLAEMMSTDALALPGRDALNIGMGAGSLLGLAGFLTTSDPTIAGACLASGVGLSGLMGLHMTASIGGADMPVVITLLNSYSGWALCAEGMILDSPVLTIVGALIGSSGAFLTNVMCEGMNRSLANVILGGFGTSTGGAGVASDDDLVVTEIDSAGTAEALKGASKVLFVPGYGLAVAQAQGIVADISSKLIAEGKTVHHCAHSVAGRMPGQLNVLLAEAGVPYDIVLDMEEISDDEMADYDVAVVIGANDTINKAARDDPSCAIAGMPVIPVWLAKHCVVLKRSANPRSGYANLANTTFGENNCDLLLGSAKDTLEQIRSNL